MGERDVVMGEREQPPVGSLTTVAALGHDGEHVETLLAGPDWRLERIVSRGQTTPVGDWYDQAEDEWVAVVTGAARLVLLDPGGTSTELSMAAGDWVLLPAHHRHRVAWTDPDVPTVWLALFTAAIG